jgi:hypothetical protein
MKILPSTASAINSPLVFSMADFYVFDTVSLSVPYPPSQPIDYEKIFKYKKEFRVWTAKTANGRISVTFRFTKNGWFVITATFSIPTLFRGNNLFIEITESDIEKALEIISEEVTNLLGFTFDAPSSKVTRMDGNRDFSTVDKHHHLAALELHRIDGMKSKRHPIEAPLLPTTGYEFYNRGQSKRITVYDKFAHLNEKHPELPEHIKGFARTYLRVEVRVVKYYLRKYVRHFFGSSDRTASKVLKPDFAVFLVEQAIRDLDSDRDVPTIEEYKQTILDRIPRTKQAYELIRFAELIDCKGIEGAKKELGKNKFYYRKGLLTDAGIWRTYFARNSSLSALTSYPNDDWRMYYDDEFYN